MTTIAVFVNDAEHARSLLQPLVGAQAATRWLVVVCTPRLTRRIGKFASQASRRQWRAQWADKLTTDLMPVFDGHPAGRPTSVTATCPLPQLVQQLRLEHGSQLQLLDARKPRLGGWQEPTEALPQGHAASHRWVASIGLFSGMSLLLALSD